MKSSEPVFCSEKLSFLPYKKQQKSDLQFWAGKFKFFKNFDWMFRNISIGEIHLNNYENAGMYIKIIIQLQKEFLPIA